MWLICKGIYEKPHNFLLLNTFKSIKDVFEVAQKFNLQKTWKLAIFFIFLIVLEGQISIWKIDTPVFCSGQDWVTEEPWSKQIMLWIDLTDTTVGNCLYLSHGVWCWKSLISLKTFVAQVGFNRSEYW